MIDTGQSASGWHRLETFIQCPRKFAYREVMRLVPLVLDFPLALGTALHVGLGEYYAGRDWNEELNQAAPRWSAAVPKAKQIIREYLVYYARENLDIVAVEHEVSASLRGLLFTRRLDLVIRRSGKLWILDHKSAGNLVMRQKTLDHDPSLFTQAFIGEAILPDEFGVPWGGFQVNLLGTQLPATFIRTAPMFRREWMDRVGEDLAEWLYEVNEHVASHRDPWTYRRSWQCQGRYRRCEYYPLCRYGRREISNYAREER